VLQSTDSIGGRGGQWGRIGDVVVKMADVVVSRGELVTVVVKMVFFA